jgi:CheY-like chemotaxis protein
MLSNPAPSHLKPRVLIVDDQPDTYELLQVATRHCAPCDQTLCNVSFDYAAAPTEAVALLNETCYDACVLDIRLKGFNGLNLGALIRERDVNVPLAYYTGLDSEEARAEATRQRAFFWLKSRIDHPVTLLNLIRDLAQLNPCIEHGRVDNHGHLRRLPVTPIVVPAVLATLAAYADHKQQARATTSASV